MFSSINFFWLSLEQMRSCMKKCINCKRRKRNIVVLASTLLVVLPEKLYFLGPKKPAETLQNESSQFYPVVMLHFIGLRVDKGN